MMLPLRRPTSPQLSSLDTNVKASETPSDTPNDVNVQHLDYDRQPLCVKSLAHYIEPVVDDDRFHVH